MPTYDYRCDTCEKTFEVFQSFHEDPISECLEEDCSGSVKKIFSAPGISFKGSGFYKNDSRSSGSKKTASEPAKSSSDDTKTSTPTKEAKDSTPSPSSSSTDD
ncbi:MAG: FmdB family zinc ribbon protein [Actinomycetota bacterium]|nr:FmdB family zinc ribbon protein [Actinomycetota bacterium]MEC8975068.1 FmdB family zinc ribbon protein [Actinomycetota bacterium]